MLSIYLLLNFQNLRRAISKLSSQVVMEPRQQVFPRVLRKIVNFRGGSTKIAYFQGDVPENRLNQKNMYITRALIGQNLCLDQAIQTLLTRKP